MEVFATDIKDKKEFGFEGDRLVQKACLDQENQIWLYERYNREGRLFAYELVKGVRKINPDGNVVFKYPSSEQFGKGFGFFIAKRLATEEHIKERVKKLVGKKSLKTPQI